MQTTFNTQACALLADCKHKLQLYRDASNGQYLGGVEYTKLIQRIDECRAALASPVSTGIAGDENARFEKWAITCDGNCSDRDLRKRDPVPDGDTYFNPLVQRDWEVWQARAAVPAQPTQPQGDGCKFCLGAKGGVPGNANVIGGEVICDYCTALLMKVKDAEKANPTSSIFAAQPQQVEGVAPTLTVWYGPMPESNGAQNFTATLMRKGASMFDTDSYSFARSEYPDRVRYDADCMRYLIGELAERPDLFDYDADKHSGYVESTLSPEPAKVGGAGELVKRLRKLAASGDAHGTDLLSEAAEEIDRLAAKASGVQAADLTPDQKHEILELARVSADSYCDGAGVEPSQIDSDAIFFDAIMRAVFNPAKESK